MPNELCPWREIQPAGPDWVCDKVLGHDGVHHLIYPQVVRSIKDSGRRQEFDSGMVRDVEDGKMGYHKVLDGPMFFRWVQHLTYGALKYPDEPDGSANWMKADGETELLRFRRSALRHFHQWWAGQDDEDHAAAVFFNINGAEYVKERMRNDAKQGTTGV